MKRILRSHLTEVDAHFGTHTVIPEESIDEVCKELAAAMIAERERIMNEKPESNGKSSK